MKPTLLLFGLLGLATACGSDPTPPPVAPAAPAPAPAPAEKPAPPPEKKGDDPSQSNIQIAEEIRKACGISESDAYFAYNSADVRPQDKAILNKLAKCFTDGPLKGRLMRLVGHADPRGEEEYNMALGGNRADNIKNAIVGEGMASAKVETTSRGELDATGTDDASWIKDRRVDIMLGD